MEESFTQGNSFIHNRDPRGKIIIATLFITTVALANSYFALLFALVMSFLTILLSRISLGAVFKRIVLVNGFTFFLWVSLPLTFGGINTISFGPLSLSYSGVLLAALITLKTNAILCIIIAILSTSTIADLGHALNRLHFPDKMCFILLFSYRYIFVIYQEYSRLLRAAQMRCFSPGTNIHTYRTFAYLFGMTLVNSYNRSQRVHQAMLLRGFNGKLMSLQRYTLTGGDILFILASLICITSIITLHFL